MSSFENLDIDSYLKRVRVDKKKIKIDNEIFNDLDSYDKINEKFQQLTSRQYRKLHTRGSSQQLIPQNLLLTTRTSKLQISQNASNISSMGKQNSEIQIPQKTVQFEKTSIGKKNFVIKFSGQLTERANVREIVSEKYSNAINDICENIDNLNIIMVEKILGEYNVNINTLKSISDIEQRKNCIMEAMHENIQNNLYQFQKQITKRLKKSQKQDIERWKKMHQKKNVKYSWLKVNSKYDHLKPNLQAQLLEEVDNFDNKQILREQMQKRQLIKSNTEDTSNSLFAKIQTHINLKKNEKIIEEKYQNIDWDKEKESEFLETREKKKNQFKKMSKYLNFFELTMFNVLYSVNIDNSHNSKYKDKLFEQYRFGEGLSEKDMIFIERHSDLIYKHLDQDYIQMMVQMIDPDILDQLEWQIAEKIILKYKKSLDLIKDKRNEYLADIRAKVGITQLQANAYENYFLVIEPHIDTHPGEKQWEKKQNLLKAEKKQMYSYKLPIKKPDYAKNTKKFTEFYSQGPATERQYKSTNSEQFQHPYDRDDQKFSLRTNNWISQQVEEQAIKKLQTFFRAALKKRAFRKVMTDLKEQRAYGLDNRVRRIFYRKNMLLNMQELQSEVINQIEEKRNSPQNINFEDKFMQRAMHRRTQSNLTDVKTSNRESTKETQYSSNQYSLMNEHPLTFTNPKIIVKTENNSTVGGINNNSTLSTHTIGKHLRTESAQIPLKKTKTKSQQANQKNQFQRPIFNLEVKHRKLLLYTKQGHFQNLFSSGFVFKDFIDINVRDEKGNSPLYYTVKNNDIQFTSWLLQKQADVNLINSQGNTALHMAFKNNNVDMIVKLMDHQGNLNMVNSTGHTPVALCTAATLKMLNLENTATKGEIYNRQLSQYDNNKVWEVDKKIKKDELIGDEMNIVQNPLYYQQPCISNPVSDIKVENQIIHAPFVASYQEPSVRQQIIQKEQKLKKNLLLKEAQKREMEEKMKYK